MPLSEHEQRMLDEIESALYAEDPKFVSNVSKQRVGRPSARRQWQAVLLLLLGLVLLVGGIMVRVRIGDFPILSLVGFFVMFGGGLILVLGPRGGSASADGSGKSSKNGSKGSLSSRMEDRFNRRFHQDGH
ncbi:MULTISPECIES: DUF3040 domain-containing protein [unclassified Gordonia (in: high G+C Gram-positive bacteria)]|uniref:DUF3040 domain-containing protein n=1 Tax=unclassified Gordonia (in: high G+C Gram-positive bacteria) TaxID=2657482 RepID=UPI001FFE90A6|nr:MULTISPECIES: DUF3040 domain-containing protein [unclassified Gordonia (in: high G+C Gram-positive bacteria)]UQE73592.1 DUF3040 domain-containing protein [Gordonia sp. PP30]